MIWMIFIKTLKIRTQIKNVKIFIVFNHMTADIPSNKKINAAVTELFVNGRKLKFLLFLLHNLILLFQKILE